MTRIDSEHELVAALQDLPKSINPNRDLWLGIDQRLDDQLYATPGRSRWKSVALAASFALTLALGLVLGQQLQPETDVPNALVQSAYQQIHTETEQVYQTAFREFVPVGAARGYLEAATVEEIESGWKTLMEAEKALNTALKSHPNNPFLTDKLLELRNQQLDFLRQLAVLDQNSRRTI